jgi:hypothetical protein
MTRRRVITVCTFWVLMGAVDSGRAENPYAPGSSAVNRYDPNLGTTRTDANSASGAPLYGQTIPNGSSVTNFGSPGNRRCPDGMYQQGSKCYRRQTNTGGGGAQ